MKRTSNWVKVSYLSGQYTQRDIPNSEWVDSSSSPLILMHIVHTLTDDDLDILIRHFIFRMCLSILSSYKVIIIPKAPDYSTILNPPTHTDTIISSFDIVEIFRRLNIDKSSVMSNYQDKVSSLKWHLTSSSGPNGQAVWNSHIDAKALINDIHLFSTLVDFSNLFGTDHLLESLYALESSSDEFLKLRGSRPKHSKLHHIFEKGNKCRVIAIADYFTQEALTPLHDVLAQIVSQIPTDGTFSQDKAFSRLLDMSRSSSSVMYSYDLSAATDRLPISLSERIISELFTLEHGKLWRALLTERVFIDNYGNKITYNTGQGMGLKTSFPILALTHHCIVQQAAILSGFTIAFQDYSILGDDIVINDKNVSRNYYKLISELGLQISEHKSITPNIISNGFEFASRLGLDGIELSPLPVKLMSKIISEPEFSADLQNELSRRSLLSSESFWLFMSVLLPKTALTDLAKLNGLPTILSGLHSPNLPIEASALDYRNWSKEIGISESDVINYYNYCVVSESLIKLDRILKKSVSLESLISESMLDKGYNLSSTVSHKGTEITLLEFVERDLSNDIFFKEHPVKKIMSQEGLRMSDLLSDIMSGNVTLTAKAITKLVNSLHSSITDIRFTPDTDITISLRRRLLEKVFSLLKNSVRDRKDRPVISQTFNFTSINQMWLIKVGLGIRLQISPIIKNTITSRIESKMKLTDTFRNVKF
jgi:hypothetical protein